MTAQGLQPKVTLRWLKEWHSVDKCLPTAGREVCAFQQVERQDIRDFDGRTINEVGTAYYWLVNVGGRVKMERRFRSSFFGGGGK